ncbi:MAG: glycosyltransferase family 4 protein [Bacteroidetes bacterium]|nr:glycosyltransferase family 4 protein [Bacteroidota bacterium]
MLKIVFLHGANDPYSSERIRYFVSKNHKVYSITFPESDYKLSTVTSDIFRLRKKCIDKIPLIKRVSHYNEINTILRKINPDILHVVNALNLFYTNTKYSKIKIIENEGSDVIFIPRKYKFLIPYYKYYYSKVDGVLQDSRLAYNYAIKYGAPVNTELNKIIEIGIDFTVFNKEIPPGTVREKYNLGNRPIIFHSRGINSLYNIDIILQSVLQVRKRFQDCIYILTTTKEQLTGKQQRFIDDSPIGNNILFAGYQDRIKDLKHFYRDADVHISVPSSDSSPFSVYESMACLTPNIVTDLPWVYSRFLPNKHVITCTVRDSISLATSIIDVITGNHNLDLEDAYKIVSEQINLQKENEKLEHFYRNLLKIKSDSIS